MQSAVSTREG